MPGIFVLKYLAVFLQKMAHKTDELLYITQRNRIVERNPASAY